MATATSVGPVRSKTVRSKTVCSRAVLTAALAMSAVVTVVGLQPAAALVGADRGLDQRLSAASDDIASANKAVAGAAVALAAARSQLPAARTALATANAAVAKASRVRAIAEAGVESAVTASLKAQEQLDIATARIHAVEGNIGDLARVIYTRGPYAEIETVLSASSPSDFAERLAVVRAVSRSNNQALLDVTTAKAELVLRGLQLEAAKKQALDRQVQANLSVVAATTAQAQAEAAAQRVAGLVAQSKHAVSVAAAQKGRVLAQYKALKAEQAKIEREARAHSGSSKGSGSAGHIPTGSLQWPIPGAAVVQGVGPRIHPVYGYRSCHTGDDIRGSYGTPIHSAASGVVISVESGGPYGLHTLIGHGGGLSTMYAHQSGTTVSAGQSVRAGEVIGYVGNSGWATGPHLHFEVHVDGVPYDPLGWFGSAKKPVSC